MTSRTFPGRIPELDGLRGVAIGLVLICHCLVLTYKGALGTLPTYVVRACMLAWSGVDLFFVLSGFLIGGILLDAKSSDHYFRTFYIRRAFRILPLYAVLSMAPLLLVLASAHLRNTACTVFGHPFPWYVSALLGQNIWIAFRGWDNTYLPATWSLAVEEQFYLTLPFIVRKVSTRTLISLNVAMIVAAPFFRLFAARVVGMYAPYTLVHFDGLMFGVLAAIAVRRAGTSDVFGKHTLALLTVSASLLCITLLVFIKRGWNKESYAMNIVGYSVIAAFYCCLLLLAIAPRDNLLRALLRQKVLIMLGTAAYCVYLVHVPMLYGISYLLTHRAPHLEQFKDFGPLMVALALTFAIAAFSWRYFEQPLIAAGHNFLYKFSSVPAHTEFEAASELMGALRVASTADTVVPTATLPDA